MRRLRTVDAEKLALKAARLGYNFLRRDPDKRYGIDGEEEFLVGEGCMLKVISDGDPRTTKRAAIYIDVFHTALQGRPDKPKVTQLQVEYKKRNNRTAVSAEILAFSHRGDEDRRRRKNLGSAMPDLQLAIDTFKAYGLR